MARPIAPPRLPAPDFVAVDVETANADPASICQIGFATFACGALLDNWAWAVNPQTYFSGRNIAIHGIRAADVAQAPSWAECHADIVGVLGGRVVVSHTAFDVTAIARACARAARPQIDARWVDSARIARRAFVRHARRGWGLGSLARFLDIDFAHHDAGEDARAAGLVVVAAICESGLDIDAWVTAAHRPLHAFRREAGLR